MRATKMTEAQAKSESTRRWGADSFALRIAVNAGRDRALQYRFGVSASQWTVGRRSQTGELIPYGVGDSWVAAFRSADAYTPGNEHKYMDMRRVYAALNRSMR